MYRENHRTLIRARRGNHGGSRPQSPAAELSEEALAQDEPAYDSNMVIEFNDDVLENMIRITMGKPEGDILVSDAQGVTLLELLMDGNDWSQPRITDLSALKYFTNLNYLTIGWSVLNAEYWDYDVDISALAGMTKMETLAILCINASDFKLFSRDDEAEVPGDYGDRSIDGSHTA